MNERVAGITVLAGIEVDIRARRQPRLRRRGAGAARLGHGLDPLGLRRSRASGSRTASSPQWRTRTSTASGTRPGRKINRRPPYDLDLERVFEKAVETGTFLEINAQPDRLDLTDNHARAAAEAGVRIVVSTDAHRIHELDNLELGVAQARRGWVTADQIVNTRTWAQVKKLMKK